MKKIINRLDKNGAIMSNKLKKEIKRLNTILRSKDDKKILAVVNKLLKDYPNILYFVRIKSIALTKLEKYKELLKLHDKYSEEIYMDIDIVHTKLYALEDLKDIKKQAIFVNKSLIYYPEDFHLVTKNDNILNHFQSTTEDIEFLKDLLKVNPNNIEIYMHLGYASAKLARSLDDFSKQEDAINYFDKAIELCKLDPNHDNNPSHIYIDKGESLASFERYDEAIKTFDLIDDEDINADIKFREKSIVYREIGDYDLALKYIDKAIEIDNDSYLMELKGRIYLCMKDYDLAIKCFNQSADDDDRAANYYKAFALKEKGEYVESINCLNMIKKNENIKKGWADYEYERAQKLIKEINLNK
ncbi:MAG: tetratricopeptide repeat protein [Methanobrevibacter sp.]|jgi:tetratricopeptide (TPR) repeat protein|nr:tetratricopeptide repeat protein [Methanobrevibacter sp.]